MRHVSWLTSECLIFDRRKHGRGVGLHLATPPVCGGPPYKTRQDSPYAHGRGGLPKRTHRVRLPTVHRSPIESVTWVRAPPAYHPPAALMSEDDDVPTMDKCAVR